MTMPAPRPIQALRTSQSEPRDEDDGLDHPDDAALAVPAAKNSALLRLRSMQQGALGGRTQIYICTQLTGDRDAGRLLSKLVSWARKATRKRGLPGKWNANSRDAILAMLGSKRKKYRRVREILIERDLMEFRLHFFGGKTHIFTRPTAALMPYFPDAVTRCRSEAIRHKGPDTGPDTGPDLTPLVLPSSLKTKREQEDLEEGRGRQPTPGAATPPEQVSVRTDSTVQPLIKRDAARSANAALVAQVQEVLDRDLSSQARRAALLVLLRERDDVPGVRRPSKMHGDRWQGFSAEVLVRRHVAHLECADRVGKKRGISRPAGPVMLADADLKPKEPAVVETERQARKQFVAAKRAQVFELRDQGLNEQEISTRLGMSLPVVRCFLLGDF